MVGAQSLGHQACEAKQGLRKSQGRRGSKALPVILHRIWIEGWEFKWSRRRRLPINLHSRTTDFPPIRSARDECPCRDAGVGEVALGLAMLTRKQNAASHIDPPASSNAIMRRARPYRGENHRTRQGCHGELSICPGSREEQPRPEADLRRLLNPHDHKIAYYPTPINFLPQFGLEASIGWPGLRGAAFGGIGSRSLPMVARSSARRACLDGPGLSVCKTK